MLSCHTGFRFSGHSYLKHKFWHFACFPDYFQKSLYLRIFLSLNQKYMAKHWNICCKENYSENLFHVLVAWLSNLLWPEALFDIFYWSPNGNYSQLILKPSKKLSLSRQIAKIKFFHPKFVIFFFAAFLEQSFKANRKNFNLYTQYAERNLNGIEQRFNETFVRWESGSEYAVPVPLNGALDQWPPP